MFSGVDWQFLRHRHHHFALGFAARTRVLFIEPPMSWWWWFRSLMRGRPQMVRRLQGLRLLEKRVIVYSPFVLPFGKLWARIYRWNVRWLRWRMRRLIHRLGLEGSVLWVTTPAARPYVGHLAERLVCFDCLDDYESFEHPYLKREMGGVDELAARSRFVLATARGLYERCRRANPRTYLVPNAADVAHFSAGVESVPGDIAGIPRPIVGYIGSIFEWIDLELLEALARGHPEWSIVLIGPRRHADTRSLERFRNAHVLGERPYHLLPRYLHAFDVCLVPFKRNPVTEGTNPVKVYEYLAAGKPVVGTRLAELESFLPHIRLAEGADEFGREIAQVLEGESGEQQEARRRFAEANTWGARLDRVTEIIEQELGTPGSA